MQSETSLPCIVLNESRDQVFANKRARLRLLRPRLTLVCKVFVQNYRKRNMGEIGQWRVEDDENTNGSQTLLPNLEVGSVQKVTIREYQVYNKSTYV